MAIQTTTFKGARYIVKFHDPIEWADTESYEAIESVQHNGFTYISKQPVPVGVQIDNEAFWLLWADPNAQMEQLRQLVSQYVDNVEELSGVVGEWANELATEIETRENADNLINDFIPTELIKTIYRGRGGNSTIYYCIIDKKYKPRLNIANDTIDTTEHEIKNAMRNHSTVLVNCSTFNTSTGAVDGPVISDGVIYQETGNLIAGKETLIMTENGKLASVDGTLTASQIKTQYNPVWAAMSWYPIIENGSFVGSSHSENDYQPRTFIAQDANGNYLVGVCGGRKPWDVGMSLYDIYDFIESIGFIATFAYNLDGGASSSMTYMGSRVNELVDNNHRAVTTFLSWQVDEVSNPKLWETAYSNSMGDIGREWKHNSIIGTTANMYITKDANSAINLISVDRSESEFIYSNFGIFWHHPNDRNRYGFEGKVNYDDTSRENFFMYTPDINYLTQKGNAVIDNRRNDMLTWAPHAKNVEHTIDESFFNTRYILKFIGIFQVSGYNYPVQFWTYNFGIITSPNTITGSVNYRSILCLPSGNHAIVLTIDYTNKTVKFTIDPDITITLQSLIAVSYY